MKSSRMRISKTIRHVRRLSQILNICGKHGLLSLFQLQELSQWLTPEQVAEAEKAQKALPYEGDPASLPYRLRCCLEELGPAFVKLGQMLAVRQDLLPKPFIAELSKLHQDVSPISFSEIKHVLKQELGALLEDFSTIDEKPIAAGSIAQVHRATLKQGDDVVLKVQRPSIKKNMLADLELMMVLVEQIQRLIPETAQLRLPDMVAEFRITLLSELDFVREGGNTATLSRHFQDDPHITFPRIYWPYTTTRILAMSYLDGVSGLDRASIAKADMDPRFVVELGLTTFLRMVFVHGAFHGDLHPGNIILLRQNRIGIIDCGATVRINRDMREHLAALLVAIVQHDFEAACRSFVDLTEPGPQFRLQAFQDEVTDTLAPFIGLDLTHVRPGKLLWDLAGIAAKHKAPLPGKLILFFRTMAIFEGIGIQLDPEFDVMATCQSFTDEIVRNMYSKEVLTRRGISAIRDLLTLSKNAPTQVFRLLKIASDGDLVVHVASEDLARFNHTALAASTRLTFGLIIASAIIALALILVSSEVSKELIQLALVSFVALAVILFTVILWTVVMKEKDRK